MDCIIQVTKWQQTPKMLEEWEWFLKSRGHKTEIKNKTSGTGCQVFGLFRSLTKTEVQEIKDKKYLISGNSLERRDVNGRRIK